MYYSTDLVFRGTDRHKDWLDLCLWMGPEEPLSFPYPPQAVCSPKFTEPRTTYWKLVGARPAFGKQPVFAFLYHQMHKGNPVYLKAVLLSSSLPQTPKGRRRKRKNRRRRKTKRRKKKRRRKKRKKKRRKRRRREEEEEKEEEWVSDAFRKLIVMPPKPQTVLFTLRSASVPTLTMPPPLKRPESPQS
ncbi:cGMP-gated cation channel alpha-1-like [Rattus norvegicus]|uniref:cGMP-gated cation channel alpha-1-like n=1 Tax=Rattus norvegicus TaxID=10116 RepID=UPI002FD80EB2